MRYLEQKGIIHRDLALRNLLVTTKIEAGKKKYLVKVADFGLSKVAEKATTNQTLEQCPGSGLLQKLYNMGPILTKYNN